MKIFAGCLPFCGPGGFLPFSPAIAAAGLIPAGTLPEPALPEEEARP